MSPPFPAGEEDVHDDGAIKAETEVGEEHHGHEEGVLPALPEPVVHEEGEEGHHHHHDGVDPNVAKAVADAVEAAKLDDGAPPPPEDAAAAAAAPTPKKRCKKLPLTKHEALTFANRGIYVDIETGQLRCSCNHKPCHKWDAYNYTRHFGFNVHKKYETERLDEAEILRLRESKEHFTRMNPISEPEAMGFRVEGGGGGEDNGLSSMRKRRKMDKRMENHEKILSVEESRVQERHWMEMWKDAKNELKSLRQDLREEDDEEIKEEILADIEGLKKRKGDWARLLGLNEVNQDITVQL